MAEERDITAHQLKALRALPGPNGPGMVAVELAAGLGLGRRAAVTLLVSLERDHLAARCPDGGWRKTSAGKIAASPHVERVACRGHREGIEVRGHIGGRERRWRVGRGGWTVTDAA